MRDRLPPIHIIVANAPRFLERMATIAQRSRSLAVSRQSDAPASELRTVANDADGRTDGSGRGGAPTVRANPLA
jgi:hypothetical protein